ncbi:MAG: HD domain-containing protein [Ignavibacteria bacterium]
MIQKRIAAIDLGTNSFHLVIVEVKNLELSRSIEEIEATKNFEILYRQREVVRINFGEGRDTDSLTKEGIERAIKTLKDFKAKINEFNAEAYAIATSAIREAKKRDEFISFVKENLGIEINVVSGYEEARLIYLGVLQGLNVYDKQVLLIDIGGGSTELLVGKRGKILFAGSFKLGAVRLTQMFFDGGKVFTNDRKQECEEYVKSVFDKNLKPIKDLGFEEVIGTSGQIQSIARMLYLQGSDREKFKTFHGQEFTSKQFDKVSKKILSTTSLQDLQSIPQLDEKRAEIIVPGTIILKVVFESLKIDRVTVSSYALREGIIINAIEKIYKQKQNQLEISNEEEKLKLEKLKNIIEFAKSYDVDLKHSFQVQKIALKIFDELQPLHNLNEDARELLKYAAILHDIGYYISVAKHHKYSYFIIKNSNLVGFSEKEIELIANIARYHRKATPKEKHYNFARLNENEKRLINILSAILRLSDGLEKTHSALINDIRVIQENGKNSFLMILRYLTYPPETELWAAEKRKKIIEKLLNIKLELKLEQLNY